MNKISGLCLIFVALSAMTTPAEAEVRQSRMLKTGWEFARDTVTADTRWQKISVPHDWAIYGPFDEQNDLQIVAVKQNGESRATKKTGRTGGLPYYGKGFYRTDIELPDTAGRSFTLVFDGAMSHPVVRLNGYEVGRWAYGYNAFVVPLDSAVRPGINRLEVDLYNKPQSSRWYPGAGLYRNVTLVETGKVHVPVWGTYVTTPRADADGGVVRLQTQIVGAAKGQRLYVATDIVTPDGHVAATDSSLYVAHGQPLVQMFGFDSPQLWSPSEPALYRAVTSIYDESGVLLDEYTTRFGVRNIEYRPDEGFLLNGQPTKFKGVCMHHDLGPLGAAINKSALRHQIEILKDMGVNAIRTSHNMPADELVELCDEIGVMLMVEPFDDWGFRPKSKNGYGTLFAEWAERDLMNMVHHFRNSPAVVMWSSGNEVPSQWGPDGIRELTFIQDVIHREDPTRPVTCGMDQIRSILKNGFAATTDIPGFNYKPQHYDNAYAVLPQHMILGSETASTVSSRGVYHFPVEIKAQAIHEDHQSSSYDVEHCSWSNIPDVDFAADDDKPYLLGQFVWTGFDYLGEPSPYDTEAWPNHSSVFGIVDLASLPKDRYYLYRSVWNTDSTTLHVLPHWTWPERCGEVTPIMVYTSYPSAEVWVNGKSQGRRSKTHEGGVLDRYRLVWPDVVYEPGEVKVVAYDADGNEAAVTTMRTAGKSYRIVLESNRQQLESNGEDLAYITVRVVDKNGVPVPTDSRKVRFDVTGNGRFVATANGDPTCLMPFQNPEMALFGGAATAIVSSGTDAGAVTLKASAPGVKNAYITIPVK